MSKFLKDYDIFLLNRPLPKGYKYDKYDIPMIKSNVYLLDKIQNCKYCSFSNMGSVIDKEKYLVTFFQYDKTFDSVWRKPIKYESKFSNYMAIATPDFSIYSQMAFPNKLWNVFMNRWLGCYYQSKGLNIIPTITWQGDDTFEYCFKGVEPGSIVCISTIGVGDNIVTFLKGYNEMMKTIKPSLIIVKGKYIEGMTGNYKIFNFNDSMVIKGGNEDGI